MHIINMRAGGSARQRRRWEQATCEQAMNPANTCNIRLFQMPLLLTTLILSLKIYLISP